MRIQSPLLHPCTGTVVEGSALYISRPPPLVEGLANHCIPYYTRQQAPRALRRRAVTSTAEGPELMQPRRSQDSAHLIHTLHIYCQAYTHDKHRTVKGGRSYTLE